MYKTIIILIIFFFSLIKLSHADEQIAFIDIDRIINQSDFGKKAYKKIDNDYQKETKKLQKIEKDLISKEQEILKQKNILSQEELDSKIVSLKKNINEFQKKKI